MTRFRRHGTQEDTSELPARRVVRDRERTTPNLSNHRRKFREPHQVRVGHTSHRTPPQAVRRRLKSHRARRSLGPDTRENLQTESHKHSTSLFSVGSSTSQPVSFPSTLARESIPRLARTLLKPVPRRPTWRRYTRCTPPWWPATRTHPRTPSRDPPRRPFPRRSRPCCPRRGRGRSTRRGRIGSVCKGEILGILA